MIDVRWVLVFMLALGATAVHAQNDTPPAPAPTQAEENAEPDEADAGLDLDALLGTTDDTDDDDEAEGESAIDDPAANRLERELTGEQLRDKLAQAVQQMDEVAGRLAEAGDTGIATQRLQEEILTNLDLLIRQVEQQQQSGGGSSNQQQQQQQQQGGQQQQQAGQQQQQQQQQQAGQQNMGQVGIPPAGGEGPLIEIDPNSATWGRLPARFRESLLEGSSDRFSAAYRALTEAYYRRIAEEVEEE